MKMKLFEYVMLFHPKDEKSIEKTKILKPVFTILAKDEKQAGMIVAREIPQEHLDNLDQLEIIVRPF